MKMWLGLIVLMSLSSWVDADPQYQVLGQLKTRDHQIVMMMGSDAMLFTITDKTGRVLVNQRTEMEIESESVELLKLVKELIANQQGRGASFIDTKAEVAGKSEETSN